MWLQIFCVSRCWVSLRELAAIGLVTATSAGYDWAWRTVSDFAVKALEFNDLLVRHPCSAFYDSRLWFYGGLP
jgi:hypothetical protein